MKKSFLWMMAAILTCGLSMALTSCSDTDDNPASIQLPAGWNAEYKLVIGEGMEIHVNEFDTKVPAVKADSAIVKALIATDMVTDVKAFQMNNRYDYFKQEYINKTAYYFNYKQMVDHNDPSKGWFKQQCVLYVAGKDRPTVLHTEGYALEKYHNRLDEIGEPVLVSALEANCLQVEYRYHGWSLPEGWTNKWNYLTAKQHSDDLHAIVTTIKNCGIIDKSSKWVSTGVSKNGMTTAHYAYYYPNEMDAYVPFCAPFLPTLSEKGPFNHILSKAAFDEDTERMEKVKAAFRAYVSNKELQAECVELYLKECKINYTDEAARLVLLFYLFHNHFCKMSYVEYEKWEPMIPKAGDSAQKFYDYIMADEKTKYKDEKQQEYERRKEYAEDLESLDSDSQSPIGTRGEASVTRFDAYLVQTNIELGGYDICQDWVEDLLTPEEKTYLHFHNFDSKYGVTYDNGKFVREFLEGMKQSNCNMMFVYGMQDPWTGGQIPDDKLGIYSQKLFIKNGIHNDAIDTWNASERNQLFQWLKGLGFDL